MKDAAVYSFGEVLRSLRHEADVSILRAQELTTYGNYERWESGQTKVRPEYLATLAEVFGIEGDLWLLTYAWLADRYIPQPKARLFEFTPQRLSSVLGRLPSDPVELAEYGHLAVGSMTHGQLAMSCLVARYGASYAGADVPLVLAATARSELPSLGTSGYVLAGYVDVLGDLARFVARTFLLAGMRQLPVEVAVAAFRQVLLLLSEPEPFASLFDPTTASDSATPRGLDGLSAAVARSMTSFADSPRASLRTSAGCVRRPRAVA